jgi:acetyl esterase/lipase
MAINIKRHSIKLLWVLVAGASITLPEESSAAQLVFREDWKEIPAALPITSDHVSNPDLILELHGAGQKMIKKSNHENIENDPFYVWSGRCRLNWAVSLSHRHKLVDLSEPNSSVRWRSKQSGDHQLRLIIKLPGERWFITEQSDANTKEWRTFEFQIKNLSWRYFNVITIAAEEKVEQPDLSAIESIGFTDLQASNNSKSSSRLDWIEVHGDSTKKPRRAAPQIKATQVTPNLPSNVIERLGLVYATKGERELKLDLYSPSNDDVQHPAVVFIHGGGWYKGSPSSYTPMAQQLAARGFVTANIEYRLSGEAPFPAAIQDCQSAVQWLRAHAERYNIEATKIGALGGSAGGHLSGLLATYNSGINVEGADGIRSNDTATIQSAVIMAGNMDFTTSEALTHADSDPRRRLKTFMGGSWDASQHNYIAASPNRHIGPKTPPLCFMDGEFNRPRERYIETENLLDAHNIPHEFHMISKAPHSFWNSEPFFSPTLDIVTKFFNLTLK